MAGYALKLHRTAEKSLRDLVRANRKMAQKIADEVKRFADNPIPTDAVHLDQNIYRIRVGDYRIIYAVFEAERVAFIGKIARRNEDTYKDIPLTLKRALAYLEGEE
jgi:mRNA-degrading endonuclease RelE of RelBE toxin-antitoxin system